MAGTIYNTEVLELSKKVPDALREVIEMCNKGAQAIADSAAQVGSPKFTVVSEELNTNVAAFVKVCDELLNHVEEYNKTYEHVAEAF